MDEFPQCLTLKFKILKNWKLFSLGLAIFGGVTMISCSKSNNTTSTAPANVLYSKWILLNMPYTGLDGNNDSTWEQAYPASGITSAIMDKGIVLTYILLGTTNAGDSIIQNADGLLSPYLSIGSIDLYTITNVNGAYFRYVIIPGGTATSSVSSPMKGYTPAQLKALSYPDAMKLLNTPASGASGNTLK
jgi:hypothetical protein